MDENAAGLDKDGGGKWLWGSDDDGKIEKWPSFGYFDCSSYTGCSSCRKEGRERWPPLYFWGEIYA